MLPFQVIQSKCMGKQVLIQQFGERKDLKELIHAKAIIIGIRHNNNNKGFFKFTKDILTQIFFYVDFNASLLQKKKPSWENNLLKLTWPVSDRGRISNLICLQSPSPSEDIHIYWTAFLPFG